MELKIKLTLVAMLLSLAGIVVFLLMVIDMSRNIDANTKALNSIDTRLKADLAQRKAETAIETKNILEAAKKK